jgi:peptidoglycan-N-acetylglucosamine deacetylase
LGKSRLKLLLPAITDILHKLLDVSARGWIGTITHASTKEPVAALTFDDGPDPIYTPRLLDILKRHGSRATFFMLGERAEQHPDLVRRIAESGHAVGNHSWDHPTFPCIRGSERRKQIRACERALAPYGQKLLRLPYGHQNVASSIDAFWLGYDVVTWSVHVWDWCETNSLQMASELEKRVRSGSVILLHDSINTRPRADQPTLGLRALHIERDAMLEAVDLFLKHLEGRMRFVTLPELFQIGRAQRQIVW